MPMDDKTQVMILLREAGKRNLKDQAMRLLTARTQPEAVPDWKLIRENMQILLTESVVESPEEDSGYTVTFMETDEVA